MNDTENVNARLRQTLFGMLIGQVLFAIACQIVGLLLIYIHNKISYSIGLWIGVLLAMILTCHMALSINRMIDKNSYTYMVFSNILRYILIIVVITFFHITKLANPFAILLGVMSLKLSAYTEPIIGRYFGKIINKIII